MDNSQAPLVEEANPAAAECGDDAELVASESDEPRDHLRDLRRTVLKQNLRTRSGGVKYSQELIRQAEGQLSLDIGDLVSACTTEADLSQKAQALSKSDKFVNILSRIHSSNSRKHSLEDAIVVLTMTGWTSISGVLQHKGEWCTCFLHAMFAFQ